MVSLEQLNEFFIYSNVGFYVDKVYDNGDYKIMYSELVKDTDCNFAIDVNEQEKISKIEEDFEKLNRVPCIAITPLSKLYDKNVFSRDNYKLEKEAWLIYDNYSNMKKIDSRCKYKVVLESTTNMKKVARLNYECFRTDDVNDPYGDFDYGYVKVYENYSDYNNPIYKREFYIVKSNNIDVGCVLTVSDENIIGIYGLAIKKQYRGFGIGKEVLKQILKICKDTGKLAFGQTAEGFYPLEMYKRIGFKQICTLCYYTKNVD